MPGCLRLVNTDLFADHCNTAHHGKRLRDLSWYGEDLTRKSLADFEIAYVCARPGCRHLFLSRQPMTKALINQHWRKEHAAETEEVPFAKRIKTIQSSAAGSDVLSSSSPPKRASSVRTPKTEPDLLGQLVREAKPAEEPALAEPWSHLLIDNQQVKVKHQSFLYEVRYFEV